jgi:hypothetical protein
LRRNEDEVCNRAQLQLCPFVLAFDSGNPRGEAAPEAKPLRTIFGNPLTVRIAGSHETSVNGMS